MLGVQHPGVSSQRHMRCGQRESPLALLKSGGCGGHKHINIGLVLVKEQPVDIMIPGGGNHITELPPGDLAGRVFQTRRTHCLLRLVLRTHEALIPCAKKR